MAATPNDEPRLRDRLIRLEPSVRTLAGSVENAIRLSGMNMNARPTPCINPLDRIGQVGMSTVHRVISITETAVVIRPNPATKRGSNLSMYRPNSTIEKNIPTPRGASSSPASIAG